MLKGEERMFRILFESVTEGIVIVNDQGAIELANPIIKDMFGYSVDELIGEKIEVLIPKRYHHSHDGHRASYMKSPRKRSMGIGLDLFANRKNGTEFPIEVSLSPFKMENKSYVVAFLIDITKRKELHEERERLAKIFEESLNEIYLFRCDTLQFIQVNQGALNNLGYSMDDMRLLNPADIKPEFSKAEFKALLEPLVDNSKDQLVFETIHERKDKSTYPVEVRLQLSKGGDPRTFIAIIIDTSERKRIVAELLKQTETTKMYFDMARTMFLVLDRDENVKLINRQGCELLGVEEEKIIGQNWFDNFIPKLERTRVRSIFQQMMHGDQTFEAVENKISTKDGRILVMEWKNTIIYDESGVPDTVLSSGMDVTEKRSVEQIKTKAMLDGQETERQRLAKELHDGLVQTLTAVNLNIKVLDEITTSGKEHQRQAYQKALKLLDMAINDTRNMSHDLMPSALEHFGLIKGVGNLVDRYTHIGGINFNFEHEISIKLKQSVETGIYRIIQELCQNATKHAKANHVTIQLFEEGSRLVLKVKDDGVGFDASMEEIQSKGIGLRNIVTRVRAMNGLISMDSSGNGTTVRIDMPLDEIQVVV